ncbi:WD40/YVTN/BNR-like repeat-containing protein [candidate division KSB1 bacterium]
MNRIQRNILVAVIFALSIFIYPGQSEAQIDPSLLGEFTWRSIGPANMGGRIVDIEGIESNPKILYAGVATGGIWRTTNAGITWEPLFDDQPVSSIGDLAVSQSNPDIIYAGTGEANGRNSSPWGGGVYKSTDVGKTWQYTGLKETHHIGRVLIDPGNPDIVYVAALGRLWGENVERGLYKSVNGGRDWENILYIDDKTGVTDIVMDPSDPGKLVAATYERKRDGFSGGNPAVRFGEEAGIWVSDDAGKNWNRSTAGLPESLLGRIGLSASRSRPGTVYAIIETNVNPQRISEDMPEERREEAENFNKENDKQFGGIFKSTDGGKSWTRMSTYNSRPFYYSQIRVDPNHDNRLWIGGVSLGYSDDGGKTVRTDRYGLSHVDFHAVWIDPNDSDHVVTGSDGGINITYDRGENWDVITQMPLAQFYAITADMRKPYYVYGGLQDNGSWGGPSRTRSRWGIRNQDWFVLGGGDGFFVQVDPTDYTTVYSESQNGGLRRLDVSTGESTSIRPRPPEDQGEGPRIRYRFDWNSPILISPHNPRTIYFGGNLLFKSVDRGDSWNSISHDLTADPDNRYSAIVSVEESPLKPGLLWAGTNDGNVYISKNDGGSWALLNRNMPGAPKKYWVKRLEASNHEPGRAYLVFDGHRNDDQSPYLFVTEDYGATWSNISHNLPEGSVYVVREDYRNPDLLFAGTEYAVFISLNRGQTWTRFTNDLPTVPVHDLFIHPRDGDLIAGTHGRGAWIVDNITPLQQLTPDVMVNDVHLFDIRPEVQWAGIYEWGFISDKTYRADNPPAGSDISYFLKEASGDSIDIEILDIERRVIRNLRGSGSSGLHKTVWNFRMNADLIAEQSGEEQRDGRRRPAPIAGPGTYLVRIRVNGKELVKQLKIEKDNPGYMGK